MKEMGFSKGNAELVSQMLFAQYMLKRAITRGKLPKRLTSKGYFASGLRLFQIESAGKGKPMPQNFIDVANSKKILLPIPVRRKPRRKRKKRPQSPQRSSIKNNRGKQRS